MIASINFDNVIKYSLQHCVSKSKSLCATFVKNAFASGGCKYISGNGFDNQKWCKANGFECIGDFVPIDNFPRPHKNLPIQFPEGYVQQVGDVCLIKHGKFGHICYAMGPDIDDWVSDYFQKHPGQKSGMGPYCYSDYKYERIQFWRHSSVLNDTPVLNVPLVYPKTSNDTAESFDDVTVSGPGERRTVNNISDIGNASKKKNRGGGVILGSNMVQR